MKSTGKSEITQATIARGRDLSSGEIFYAVKSDTQANTWYEVRWNDDANGWRCNCPATQPCKHCRAVNEVLSAKRVALALSQPRIAPVEPTEATETRVSVASTARRGSLHGAREIRFENGVPMR